MCKLTVKVAVPIILAGIFIMIAFLATNNGKLDASFYIIILFLAAFVFFFGFATGQNLSSPIKKILDRAVELSKGNLSSRVYLETKDELSELATVFNRIAEELEVSHEQGLNAEKSIGIKVAAKTKEMEETINALEQKVKNRTIELEKIVKEFDGLRADAKSKEVKIDQQTKKEIINTPEEVKISKPLKKNLVKDKIVVKNTSVI